jgi:hypothetical protein
LGIMKRLGLFQLMDIQCHYNEKIIQQFYATLSFQADEPLTFKWMCGDTMRQSNFYEFTRLLNYVFQGSVCQLVIMCISIEFNRIRIAWLPFTLPRGRLALLRVCSLCTTFCFACLGRTSHPLEVIRMLFVLPLLSSCSFLTAAS